MSTNKYYPALSNFIDINKRDKETGYKLYKFMDLMTDIDPYFYYPYILAGSFLPPKNGYDLYDEGSAILKKVLRIFPIIGSFIFFSDILLFSDIMTKEKGINILKNV